MPAIVEKYLKPLVAGSENYLELSNMRYRCKGDGVYVMIGAHDQISPDMAYSNDPRNAVRLLLLSNNMARVTFYDRPVETSDLVLRHYAQKFEHVNFPLTEIGRLPALLSPFLERQRLQSVLADCQAAPVKNRPFGTEQTPEPTF